MPHSRLYHSVFAFLLLVLPHFDSAAVAKKDDRAPTVFLIGDSTVKTGSGKGDGGQWGWGSYLDPYFDLEKVSVANRALGGRSSRTYLTEGLWDAVLAELKPGDVVLMQFGHNDTGERFKGSRPRASIKGNSDETAIGVVEQTGRTENIHSYGWYLRKFIADARSKQATAIVLSPVPRKFWKGDKVVRATDNYALWAKQAANAEATPFIDLNDIVAERYEELGQAAVEHMFADEHTHTSLAGAQLNAQAVVAGLLALGDPHLCKSLNIAARTIAPARPAQVAIPDERPILKDMPAPKAEALNAGIPTLYIMGDSTVRNGHQNGVGWGEVLESYFDKSKINVANKAIGGRSTRTYHRENRWQVVYDQLKPGDIVIMQFGHNDGGQVGDARFKRRPALPGIGNETQDVTLDDGTTESVHTYGWYLTQFCVGIKSRQAVPVICSPVPHKDNWHGNRFTPDFADHRTWCRQVAEATKSHFIDLTQIVADQYQQLGESKVDTLFADARTHTNAVGAKVNAECVVAGLKSLPGHPLGQFLSSSGRHVTSVAESR